jgi:hypothetical protein
MHPGIRTGATEMSEANPSDVKSRANETFGEMYARFEREAWAGGGLCQFRCSYDYLFGKAPGRAGRSISQSARTSSD